MKIIEGLVFIDLRYLEVSKRLSNYADIEVRFVFYVKKLS